MWSNHNEFSLKITENFFIILNNWKIPWLSSILKRASLGCPKMILLIYLFFIISKANLFQPKHLHSPPGLRFRFIKKQQDDVAKRRCLNFVVHLIGHSRWDNRTFNPKMLITSSWSLHANFAFKKKDPKTDTNIARNFFGIISPRSFAWPWSRMLQHPKSCVCVFRSLIGSPKKMFLLNFY